MNQRSSRFSSRGMPRRTAKLSKAALVDMVWNYATTRAWASGTEPTQDAILVEFRSRRGIVRWQLKD